MIPWVGSNGIFRCQLIKGTDNQLCFERTFMLDLRSLNRLSRDFRINNFPVSFRTYKNKYDLHVKVQILRAVSTTEIEKTICIDDIYGSNILSNKDRTITKQIFIKLLNELKKSNQIQKTFRLFNSSAQITETNKLTPLLLTQNKTILLRENTNYSI